VKLLGLGDADRVDAILTNPPLGGEEAGIMKGFPADQQTSKTVLLFPQYITRRLRKSL
jgi:type I restriction enzyme M protein